MTNTMVESYINENKEILHRQLLDSLGLYETEKEYAPADYNENKRQMMGYYQSETVDGITRYYKKGKRVYPNLSDDEYELLLRISLEKERIEDKKEVELKKGNPEKRAPFVFSIDARSVRNDSFAVSFMKVLSWILWIGGLIVSFISARVEISRDFTTRTVFQWSVFIPSLILYFSSGAVCMCMAEMFGNIQTIASAIQHFKAKEDL